MTKLELALSVLNILREHVLKYRETDDGGIVVIDAVGRKYTFTTADLELEAARLSAHLALKAAKSIANIVAADPRQATTNVANIIDTGQPAAATSVANIIDTGGQSSATSVAEKDIPGNAIKSDSRTPADSIPIAENLELTQALLPRRRTPPKDKKDIPKSSNKRSNAARRTPSKTKKRT